MQIRSIAVNNFKSLVDFRIDLAKFNCLIGLNGSGKSTVLQFIDFLAQLVRGDMKQWFRERKWDSSEVRSKLTAKKNVDFVVDFTDANSESAGHWEGEYNPSTNRCTWERIELPGTVLIVNKGKVTVSSHSSYGEESSSSSSWESPIAFTYEGSILSGLKEDLLTDSLLECKRYVDSIKSLELLSPEYLRQKTREAACSLGLGGQKLSAFLHELGSEKRQHLADSLKRVYPQLEVLHVKSLRSGWKQLEITELYPDGVGSRFLPKVTTEARHINDGLLRLLAVLAELQTDDRFVLFDEIENGINPELVEFVLDALVSADQQVLVTTHSPMILNYLEDDVAKDAVNYLYKTPQGTTQAIPFFSIPSLKKKLSVMGPGEAFVDTDLTALGEEIAEMTEDG